MKEQFVIDLHEVSMTEWQADCGDYHSRGKSVEEVVGKLVTYVREQRRMADQTHRQIMKQQRKQMGFR